MDGKESLWKNVNLNAHRTRYPMEHAQDISKIFNAHMFIIQRIGAVTWLITHANQRMEMQDLPSSKSKVSITLYPMHDSRCGSQILTILKVSRYQEVRLKK